MPALGLEDAKSPSLLLSYYSETGSLAERASLAVNRSQTRSPRPHSSGARGHTWLFVWVLGIRTQVLENG